MFEIFTETLEQIVTKSRKILFLNGKEDKIEIIFRKWKSQKTNKAKLEIPTVFMKILRKSAESQGYRKAIAFDKLSRNCAFYGNSINIHLLGLFLPAEFISAMKTVQNPTVFMKMQK